MSRIDEEEPSGRQIAREALVFFLVMLVAGVAIVALRVMKDGPGILAPTASSRQAR